MAFQSHVLENGHWVERTTNVVDILRKKTVPAKPNQQVPQCGILTRTIVQSPVAHWVLPVRLRSSQHNDVAFVGVRVPRPLSSAPSLQTRIYHPPARRHEAGAFSLSLG